MSRLFLNLDQCNQFFKNLKRKTTLSWGEISFEVNVPLRTLHDWRSGNYSMPLEKALELERKFNVTIPKNAVKRPQYWHIRKAARLGAVARYKKYGNPGTEEGRSKGGRNSMLTHKLLGTGFVQRKIIYYPKKSSKLAEFAGIQLGDGGISNYQVSITLNQRDDREYSFYVAGLMAELFKIKPSIYERPEQSTLTIAASSVNLVEFLVKLGFVTGNKVKQSVGVPSWIFDKKGWQAAFVRGIFDTDGSVYLDKHKIRGRVYKNLGIAFSGSSKPLLISVKLILNKLGFSPTDSHKNMILMRRENEIRRYFREIGTNNPKHSKRLKKFLMERYRSGHNGAASKAVGG